ncbi:hypothetical protein BGZ98_005534 [Dissophora globulifera]|nr:hypothetical protein BGZ98_005534 [Dissophora globulifera]
MNLIDKSLDDIIKTSRAEKKMHGKKTTPAAKAMTIPKKESGGIKTKGAAIRTQKALGGGKSVSPYARPGGIKKETALFTESYKAAKAPIKEIFTASYIPKPSTTLKLFTTNYKAGQERSRQQQQGPGGGGDKPLTTKPIRLVTTQQAKRETAGPASRMTLTTSNERIPTGPRNPGPVVHNGGSRGGDFYRPNSSIVASNNRSNERSDRNEVNNHNHNNRNSDRRGNDFHYESRSGASNNNQSGGRGNNNHQNGQRRGASPRPSDQRVHQENSNRAQHQPALRAPEVTSSSMEMDMEMDMDADSSVVSIKGSALGTSSVAFRGESGPVTIEIENLDPGTTAEDVKFVCSRFGEIKSCICINGFSQVTYARKAAGLAAVENLHGKKADNGKVLRVTMRKNAILHGDTPSTAAHAPTGIHGPMKILEKAVKGTITNAGTLYSDQLLAAQQMLKVQQHRMAQLHREEQRITSLRLQTDPQMNDMNSLSTTGVNRGFF